jgi:hypothetical protein
MWCPWSRSLCPCPATYRFSLPKMPTCREHMPGSLTT